MPIYEYDCSLCGHHLEVLQKVNEAALTDCPKCNKPGLQKLVSLSGFQLKGTGWYVTDFRNKDKKPEAKTTASGGEGNTTPASETKASGATESKSTTSSGKGTNTDSAAS